MKKMLFVYGIFSSGGTESLILRLSKYMLDNGVDVEILCSEVRIPVKRVLREYGIKFIETKSIRGYTELSKYNKYYSDRKQDIDTVLCFGDYHFTLWDDIKQKHNGKFDVLLYVLHPYTLTEWRYGANDFLYRNITRANFNKYILESYYSGRILFMDYDCFNSTFNGKAVFNEKYILPIPFLFNDVESRIIYNKARKRKKEFVILTACRADFPFKGYLKGLICDFGKLNRWYPNTTLKIVSYGKDIEVLKKWISDFGEQGRIELIEGLPYDELLKEYEEAHLFVGMGTTLLEATNARCLCLPIEYYTYECKSWGYFDSNVKCLFTLENKGSDIFKYLKAAVDMTDDEYVSLVNNSVDLSLQYYDIERVANRLKTYSCSKNHLSNLNSYILKFRSGIVESFKTIVKELIRRNV